MSYENLSNPMFLESRKAYCELSNSTNFALSDWGDIASIRYLNLIDYCAKKDAFKSIPWIHLPVKEENIMHHSVRTIFDHYKPIMMKKMSLCELSDLPILIRKLLRISKLFTIVYNVEKSFTLYFKIIYCLLDRGYKDPSIILTVWNTLCVLDKTKVAVFSGVIGKHRQQNAVRLLSFIMEAALTLKFDFWGAWTPGHKLENFKFCPVTAALLSGNVEQMLILLQYGFKPNLQSIWTYEKYFVLIKQYWRRLLMVLPVKDRRRTIIEVLLFLVKTATCGSQSTQMSMINCFRYLWSVLPTPFVTLQELQNEIYKRFLESSNRDLEFPFTENEYLRICDIYASIFCHESVLVLAPRSLEHLCKCTIRTQLQKTWNLPNGIRSLNIPKPLYELIEINTSL